MDEWRGQAVGWDQGEGRSKEKWSRWSWGLGQVGAAGMLSNELMNHRWEVEWTGFAGKAGGWGVQGEEPWGQGVGSGERYSFWSGSIAMEGGIVR